MAVLSLVRSAFGHTCLYQSLNAPRSSNADQLKKAYRRAALRYHPDRSKSTSSHDLTASTLKFQAVSAAYQILMDEKKRSVYDSTGRVVEDDNIDGSEDERSSKQSPSSKYTNNDQWETFFTSIFHELISAKTTHELDAKSYRGSSREKHDVMQYYNVCKGDWAKVVQCVSFGEAKDIKRWKRDIIRPALMRGEVRDYRFSDTKDVRKNFGLKIKALTMDDDDSSEDDVQIDTRYKSNLKQKSGAKRKQISLEDSSSSDDDNNAQIKRRLKKKTAQVQKKNASNSSNLPSETAAMSKKDKLEYRIAKKRKEKKAKEIEVAEMFHSKDWSGAFSGGYRKGYKSFGLLNNQLLDDMEKKYANSTRSASNRLGKKKTRS